MKNGLILSLIVLFVLGLADDSYGQRRGRNKYGYKKSKSKKFSKYSGGRVGYSGIGKSNYFTVGLSINNDNYFGDIAPDASRFSADYKFLPTGLGVTASKVLYPGIFGRVGFNWANISASDYETGDPNGDASLAGRYNRNLHFKNSIYELSAGFELDLIPSNSGARGRFPINPYAFVGVAGFYHAPKAKAPEVDQAGNPTGSGGEWIDLQSIGTEGQYIDSLNLNPYSKFQFSIPLGLGVKFRLPGNFDLNFEFGFRYLFTDYLDDIGGKYVDLDLFEDDYLTRSLSERGAESTDEFSGGTRNLSGITGNQTVQYDRMEADPDNPWVGGSSYVHGNNYVPGLERGSSKNNDFLVTTQIRLVYIFDKNIAKAGRAKFR